jgi:D-glycero-alpha-D-manno-heptose-7-phosphate kinase
VNVALDLPARARVEPARDGDPAIRLVSEDRGVEERHASLAALRERLAGGTGALRILARAVDAVAPEGGFTLTTAAESPAGAGLGGSSALLATVLGTLFEAAGRAQEPERIRVLAQDLEAAVLRGATGYQDYYPPLLGGCLALEGRPGGVAVERLDVDLGALERRLRLVYTGAPHHSGMTNWGTLKAYFDGEEPTIRGIHEIADVAHEVRARLAEGDLDGALRAVVDEGSVRVRLAPGVSTPAIEALDRAVRAAGALGTKVMGAGGGGCVLVVLEDGPEPAGLAAALRAGGGREIPVRLTRRGLVVEDA